MAYNRVNWQDGPSGGTPLSAANLNVMDEGIEDAHEAIEQLESVVGSFQDHIINVKAFGAVGDGTTDDTAAIQAALSAGEGAIVWIPPGTYLISDTLTIESTTTLLGAGRGKTVLKLDDGINATLIENANQSSPGDRYIIIRDLTIDGNAENQSTTPQAGISLAWAQDVQISGVEFTDCRYVGLAIGGIETPRIGKCSRIFVDSCIFLNCGEDGLSVSGDNHTIEVSKCTVDGVGAYSTGASSCFEVDDGAYDIRFVDCIAMNGPHAGFGIHAHSNTTPPSNITFINCIARHVDSVNGGGFAISGAGGHPNPIFSNIQFIGCQAFDCNNGYYLFATRNLSIIGGSVIGCQRGINGQDNNVDVRVIGVHFEGASSGDWFTSQAHGIHIFNQDLGSSNWLIQGCTIKGFGRFGMRLNVRDSKIIDNIVVDNGAHPDSPTSTRVGISFVESDTSGDCIGNRVTDTRPSESKRQEYGLSFENTSPANIRVFDNDLRGNGLNPVLLVSGTPAPQIVRDNWGYSP